MLWSAVWLWLAFSFAVISVSGGVLYLLMRLRMHWELSSLIEDQHGRSVNDGFEG